MRYLYSKTLKSWSLDKTNYRPASLLSYIPKVFERIICNQINEYIEPFLSKVLTGLRRKHNTQHSLLNILENVKEALDKYRIEFFSGSPQWSYLGQLD